MGFQKGAMKSLVESIYSQYEYRWEANLRLEQDLEILIKEGKIKTDEVDFNAWACELVTDGVPLKEYLECEGIVKISEAMGASTFPLLTKAVLGNTVISEYETSQGQSNLLVSEYNSKSTSMDTIPGHTAFGSYEKREESMSYEEKQFGEKKVQIDLSDFGVVFKLTEEGIYEDRLGKLTAWAKNAGQKGGLLREKMIVQTIEMESRSAFQEAAGETRAHVSNGTEISQANHYLATTHAAVTGLDGQSNINTDNTTDAGVKLSTAGIQSLYLLSNLMVDEKGDEVVVTPDILLTSGTLFPQAQQLLSSDGQFDTANRAVSFFRGRYLPVKSRSMTTTYKYYLGDFKRQIAWLWTRRPTLDIASSSADEAFKNRIVLRIRFAWHGGCGHTNYIYICRGGGA